MALDFGRAAMMLAISSVLCACGGAANVPLSASGAASSPWIQRAAKRGDLLYVATGGNVYILSFPGGKVVGSLNVSGYALCSDKDGDVFVPGGSSYAVLEYAHGGTQPIQTLEAGDIPVGCAVDPVTGNLAVTQEGSGAGEVAIFPNAQQPSTWYRDPDISTYGLCSYDDSGNLFVDGTGSGAFIAQLRKGSSTFRNYALDPNFDAYGDVQWDGAHIALSNPSTGQLYRLKFSKTSFKVVGTTQINDWQNNYSGHWPYVQTWIEGATFIAQADGMAALGLWRYPRGGNVGRVIGPFVSGSPSIYGVTISVAPKTH
jgi:hypothetical protein